MSQGGRLGRGVFAAAALVGLFGCSKPDPDAVLRKQDLDAASKAWEATHGAPLDTDHPAAEILASRARTDPKVTTAMIAETMTSIRLLEGGKRTRTQTVDRPFEKAADLFKGIEAVASQPVLVAVGRSETPGDPDPVLQGAPLPWSGGRLVASSRKGIGDLGARLDADPPARLVTIAIRDATGELWMYAEHSDTGWVVQSASDTVAAVHVMHAAEILRDEGAETMRMREGQGILQR